MTRPSWDETWLSVARVIALRSKCSRSQVGAVIVSPTNRIVATGYNGEPAGWRPPTQFEELPVDYFESCRHWCHRAQNGPTPETAISYADCVSSHAELAALLFCDRRDAEGGTIYTTGHPCWTCAKAIANSGLRRVVVQDPDPQAHRAPSASYKLLRDSQLEVVIL